MDTSLLTTDQVAAIYKVGRRTVLNWIKRGQLQGHRIGYQWLVNENDLNNFTPPKPGKKIKKSI